MSKIDFGDRGATPMLEAGQGNSYHVITKGKIRNTLVKIDL
jgi:hypothetical protein